MGEISRDWFDPARLFDDGYPEGLTSALRTLPQLRDVIVEEIAKLAPQAALEVGPGDSPLIEDVPRRAYLDIATQFLVPVAGLAARGSLLDAPFRDGSFDVVVAADVLTHIRPPLRPRALSELTRVARAVILFNPEPGTSEVGDSPVPTEPLTQWFEAHGFQVRLRRFMAFLPGFQKFEVHGEYGMALIVAVPSAP